MNSNNEFDDTYLGQLILFKFIPYLGIVSQICISDLSWKHQNTTRWRLFTRLWNRHLATRKAHLIIVKCAQITKHLNSQLPLRRFKLKLMNQGAEYECKTACSISSRYTHCKCFCHKLHYVSYRAIPRNISVVLFTTDSSIQQIDVL